MPDSKPFYISMSPRLARLLSVLSLTTLGVGHLGSAWLGPDAHGPLDLGVSLVRLVGLVSTLLLFLSNYGQMTQWQDSSLDEREVQLRNRAYVLTHRVTVSLLLLAFFYVLAANSLGWSLPPAETAGDLLIALALASLALPAAILAWRDRPLPDEG